jgi:LysM repeat protein
MLMPMTHRLLRIAVPLVLAVAMPSLSYAQATNAAPAAAPAPAVSSAPISANANTPAATDTARPATYTLAKGDTLESVGKQWGLTGRQIQKYNKFTNAQVRKLQIGQVIKIPPEKASK